MVYVLILCWWDESRDLPQTQYHGVWLSKEDAASKGAEVPFGSSWTKTSLSEAYLAEEGVRSSEAWKCSAMLGPHPGQGDWILLGYRARSGPGSNQRFPTP